MTRATVELDELLDAFLFVSAGQPSEHEAYLCAESGVIHFHADFGDNAEPLPDDIDDAEKYIAIPHKYDLDLGNQLVMRFAGEFLPDALSDMGAIFRRRGAYARFKGLLERRGLLQQWYEYEEKATKEALREWCHISDIQVHG